MNPADARRIIRERAEDSGHIVIVPHARKRMFEREIDFLDIQRVLRGGSIIEGPYEELRTGHERCTMTGLVDGRWVRVVIEIPVDAPDLLVVTVID